MQMIADCATLDRRLLLAMDRQLSASIAALEIQKRSLKDPELLIERFMQRVDDLQSRSESALEYLLDSGLQSLNRDTTALMHNSPEQRIISATEYRNNLSLRSSGAMQARLDAAAAGLAVAAGRLETLSPLAVLARGYAVARKQPGARTVRRAGQLAQGDIIELLFTDGTADCTVNSVTAKQAINLDSQPSEH
jgi:exodeoxyribonuclease VII large subunit